MSTLSNILNTGRQALQVQEVAMQVIGHNTANINTEGFSRRRIDFQTSLPGGIGMLNLGSGVDIQRLSRIRDQLLDGQIRESRSQVGYWQQRDDALNRIEEIFNGLGDANIDSELQAFWSAWQDLSNDPESESERLALVQKAQSLVSSIRRTHSSLAQQLRTTNDEIIGTVEQANLITAQIARLNVDIQRHELGGYEAADLRDSRDLLLEQLASLINITSEENPDGLINVYTGGRILVQTDRNIELSIASLAAATAAQPIITYGNSTSPIEFTSGELKALIDLRETDIISGMRDLDTLAGALASRVNDTHRTGYGLGNVSGYFFFSAESTDAKNLTLDALILDDPARIATAAAADSPGDNSIALAIAAVQHEKLLNDGRMTLDEFNRGISLRIGSSRAYATSQYEVEQAVAGNLENRRQSISGVSMDEEMTRLIQVQKAYDAAAKIVQTADEMINTILSIRS